jgi:hypothetical protein
LNKTGTQFPGGGSLDYLPIFLFLLTTAAGLWLLTKSDSLKGTGRALFQVFCWILVGISLVMVLSFIFLNLTGGEKTPADLKKEKDSQFSGCATDEKGVPIGFKQKEGYLPGYGPAEDQK